VPWLFPPDGPVTISARILSTMVLASAPVFPSVLSAIVDFSVPRIFLNKYPSESSFLMEESVRFL
jgi:hypothetical protein